MYREHYPRFLHEQKKLVWEVNIWAWLEANTDWRPDWYSADHNDRILHLPDHFFVKEETIEDRMVVTTEMVTTDEVVESHNNPSPTCESECCREISSLDLPEGSSTAPPIEFVQDPDTSMQDDSPEIHQ